MKDGCALSMFAQNMQMYDRFGKLTHYHCGKYQIGCNGKEVDKKICPEWGPTLEAEKHYENI